LRTTCNVFVLLILSLLPSCVINLKGWKVDYATLSAEDLKMVVITNPTDDICQLENDKKVYAINAGQLINCLAQTDSALVYEWSANCHSESCISIVACQKYCNENGLKLFVISEYYDAEIMRVQNFADKPIFIPNHFYYNTEKCNKLNSKFFNEVFKGKRPRGEHKYSRFHVFHKSNYASSMSKLF